MGSKKSSSTVANNDNRVVNDNSGATQLQRGSALSTYGLEGSFSGIAGNNNQITGTDPGLLAFASKILDSNASGVTDIVNGALSTLGAQNATVQRINAQSNANATESIAAAQKSLFSESSITMIASIAGIAAAAIAIFGKGK